MHLLSDSGHISNPEQNRTENNITNQLTLMTELVAVSMQPLLQGCSCG